MVTPWFLFQCTWVLEYSLRCRLRIGVDIHGPYSWIRQAIISTYWARLRWDLPYLCFWVRCDLLVVLSDRAQKTTSFSLLLSSPIPHLFPPHYSQNSTISIRMFSLGYLLISRCNISHVLRLTASGYVWRGIYGNEKIGLLLSSSVENSQM